MEFEWPSDAEIDAFLEGNSPFSALPDNGESVLRLLWESGRRCASALSDELGEGALVLMVGRPRDFEGFAAGMVEEFEERGIDTRVGAVWLQPTYFPGTPGIDGSQVMGSYIDDGSADATAAFVASGTLDDWAAATALLLWTKHRVPSCTVQLVGHRAESMELEATLAEVSLAFDLPAEGLYDHCRFEHIDQGTEFDRLNEFAGLSPVDDHIRLPDILQRRMDLQAERRSGLEPPPKPPAPTAPSPTGGRS